MKLSGTLKDENGADVTVSVETSAIVAAPPPVVVEPPPVEQPAPTTSAYPDATNTGVPSGVTLKPSGSLDVKTNGAVISGLDITGMVFIAASNVVLKNCRVTSSAYVVVNVADGFHATIQDCEINGVGTDNDGSHGIYGQGTFLRNNIYNVENGITLNNGDSLIQGNYIHDLKASGSPHYDGIQMDGGQSNVQIVHNTIINPHKQTAAIMIDNYFGSISNVQIDGNWLEGGGYTLYSDGQFSGGTISGVSVTNNKFGIGDWGYAAITDNTLTQSGNTDLNGAPITL